MYLSMCPIYNLNAQQRKTSVDYSVGWFLIKNVKHHRLKNLIDLQ